MKHKQIVQNNNSYKPFRKTCKLKIKKKKKNIIHYCYFQPQTASRGCKNIILLIMFKLLSCDVNIYTESFFYCTEIALNVAKKH